jgi:hypothetical protein
MIEDIDFLYQNSKKENLIILVDSASRNKNTYPNVADFTIMFEQPFTNVYGVDILNTTIPRTQFMMEKHNNTLSYKFGYKILNEVTDYNKIELMPQDFSSPVVFFQRANDQIGPRFTLDNYENVVDTEASAQRSIADFPIPRMTSSMSPFFINITRSSVASILGFDCIYKKTDSDFNTMSDIMNTFCPIRIYPLEYTEPFEYHIIRYNSNCLVFNYKAKFKHVSKFKGGSFLQNIKLNANNNFKSFDGTNTIFITIVNETSNHTLIHRLPILFTNNTKQIEIKRFVNDDNTEVFGGINNHFRLHYDHVYEISISNLNEDDNFKIETTEIGFCYFYQLHNIEVDEHILTSKTLYEDNDIFVIQNETSYPESKTLVKKMFPAKFDFHISTEFVYTYFNRTSLGLLTQFKIEVVNDELFRDVSRFDMFILRIRKQATFIEGVKITDDEELCEICLEPYEDTESGKAYLQFSIQDIIDRCFFGQINFALGASSDNVSKFMGTIFVSKPINFVGSNYSFTYEYSYQIVSQFGLRSPGLINLTTENFIILRCPEIENHIRGSYSTNESSDPGMGVLNMDVQGYASGRLDFYSVIYKEFHPIGKLDKLTFRFERKSDRQLYDFKNVNLHFLMSIKFLRPFQKQTFDQSILNPNYNPNFLGYFNNTLEQGFYENSSDEDDVNDPYVIHQNNTYDRQYRKREIYNP